MRLTVVEARFRHKKVSFIAGRDYIFPMSKNGSPGSASYLPPLIFLVVSVIFILPFLLKWDYIGVGDWELFATMAAVPERTVLHYHQFPFWNPYVGGGNILFAHPEVGILSPFFILILVLGPIAGLKIQMMIAYLLGFWGTYLFAGRLGISRVASYLVSFAYFGSSYFALHFSIGHVPFTHFCFLPWFVYFILKTRDDWKYFFGSAVSMALIVIGNGAAVPFLYTVFFSGFFILLYSFEKKRFKLICTYILSIVLGLLLAAVKFIPMYHYLSQSRWEGMPEDHTPVSLLLKTFFSFNQAIFQVSGPEQYWGWHEYSAYISPLVILLAVVGLIYSFKRCRLWLLTGFVFLVFGLGHFSDISLWNLVLHIPGFSSIRSPARAFQFVILSAAVISGFGLDDLLSRFRFSEGAKKILAVSVIGLVLLTNFLINLPAFSTIGHKTPQKVHFDEDFRHIIGRKDNIYGQFLSNRGSLVAPWLSAYKESRGLVTPTNEVLMEYVIQGQLQVLNRRYTPNKVEYDVAPASDGVILFGIGYDDGWFSTDGRRLYENNGLVATNFNRQDNHIALAYRAPYFTAGLIISLLTICACLFLCFNRKLGKRFKAIFE